ncbi:hypothetical protein Hanom_Chr12g01089271 [Helianthus anomalus]
MPLVDLGKTLYCSKFGDSGFEAALVVPWFLLSFLERFSTLKFGVLIIIVFGLFGAVLIVVGIPYLFASSQVHSSLGKVLVKRSLLPRLCLSFVTGF